MARGSSRRAQSPERLVEEILAEAICCDDPVSVLRQARRGTRLPEEARKALRNVNEDGLRLTALLVAKLRFERLIQGSLEAGAWFDRDPAAFSAAFRRYHRDVPPTAHFPPQEAQAFERWCLTKNAD